VSFRRGGRNLVKKQTQQPYNLEFLTL